jgi:heterogeneous nuclear ribonucleoprotein F/H
VRLRGLPYSAQTKDIVQFLSDCTVCNGDGGVHFTFVPDGRPSGEAFVELQSEDDVSKALAHHNEHMGRRYVEMFRASRGQMEWECRKVYDGGDGGVGSGGGGGGVGGEGSFGGGGTGGNGGVVRLRGLPYGCAEEEVRRFFTGWLSERRGCTVVVLVVRHNVHVHVVLLLA